MTTLTLETYARVLAHAACRRGARTAEILSELGIAAEDFHAAEPALREQLTQAWVERKGITAMKFAAALGAELTRLGPLGDGGAVQGSSAGDPALAPLHAAVRPREHEVPSFLQAPPPLTPISSAASSVPAATPPEVIAPPPIVQAHADAPPASKSNIAGTVDMDLSAIVAAVKRGEIPFRPADGPPPGMVADSSTRPTTELPSKAPQAGGTMNADLSAIVASVRQGALPFNPSEGAGPATARGPSVDIEPEELPLETYASVTGALARGESREEALARHGLRPDAFDRLAKAWAQRFQREPHLLARFQELARSNAGTPRRTE